MGHRRRPGGLALAAVLGRRGTRHAPGHRRPTSPPLPGVRARVVVTLDARLPDDPGPWTIERIAQDEAPIAVRELAGMADFTVLIAPETTGILAGLTRELQAAGAPSWARPPDAIELTGDKDRLARWLGERGIATPRSRTSSPRRDCPPIRSIRPSSSRSTVRARSIRIT